MEDIFHGKITINGDFPMKNGDFPCQTSSSIKTSSSLFDDDVFFIGDILPWRRSQKDRDQTLSSPSQHGHFSSGTGVPMTTPILRRVIFPWPYMTWVTANRES